MLKFILGSGFRDQEIRYLQYLDLDFRHQIARVTAKTSGLYAKNWEERTVPLPAGLIERLRKRKERNRRGRTILSSAIRRAARTAKWIWSSSGSRSVPV